MYRALVRLNLIDPEARRPRDRKWKRWERGTPMELWQMDVVGGFVLADGTKAKALTGVDDHSQVLCVRAADAARVVRAGVRRAGGGVATLGCPGQILTDNGKVFTGRFNQPPVEVLFDRICRENGIDAPAHPATVADHDRQDRAVPPGLRTEFRTDRVFADLAAAQAELDAWVDDYNHRRPHQAIGHGHPRRNGSTRDGAGAGARRCAPVATCPPRPGARRRVWVARRASDRRRGLRQLAAGLPRRRRRRAQHRRVGHRRRRCSSSMATSSYAPSNEPPAVRSAKNEHPSPAAEPQSENE